ncbi:hypothetical protein HG530_008217 [Fusarium avenaceum]|nr:hypothetical protein HG530_008217 [Fusarium avenaceum]
MGLSPLDFYLSRLTRNLGPLGSAVLETLVRRVLTRAVGHEVVVLGGGLLGLTGTGGALAPEINKLTTTRPGPSAFWHCRVTGGPDSKAESHGCLRVALHVVLGNNLSHVLSVDVPVELLLCPGCCVVVVILLHAVLDKVPSCLCEVLNTLSVVVCRGVGIVGSQNLPVDLVEIVAQPHHGANDAYSRSSLHDELGTAEEEVEGGAESGRVALLGDCEGGTILLVVDDATDMIIPVVACGCAVEVPEIACAESWVGLAVGLVERVTVGCGLSGHKTEDGGGREDITRKHGDDFLSLYSNREREK